MKVFGMPPIRETRPVAKRPYPDIQQEDKELSAELQSIFGESVRSQRVKVGWTQGELSKRSGIAQEEISRIENGQINLTIRTMSRLAKILDGDVAKMLGKLSGASKI